MKSLLRVSHVYEESLLAEAESVVDSRFLNPVTNDFHVITTKHFLIGKPNFNEQAFYTDVEHLKSLTR